MLGLFPALPWRGPVCLKLPADGNDQAARHRICKAMWRGASRAWSEGEEELLSSCPESPSEHQTQGLS